MLYDTVILVYNTDVSKEIFTSIFMVGREECSFRGWHVPEVINPNQQRFENSKSCKIMLFQYSNILRKFRTDLSDHIGLQNQVYSYLYRLLIVVTCYPVSSQNVINKRSLNVFDCNCNKQYIFTSLCVSHIKDSTARRFNTVICYFC